MDFQNTTHLSGDTLRSMIRSATADWPTSDLHVHIRYSRGAEFSGTCYYGQAQIYVNLGRKNKYPYLVQTHIARAKSNSRQWWRELYSVEVADAYQLVVFVFLHEFYHWLVKQARRNTRQKEGRCDRFATRWLVDNYQCPIRNSAGQLVSRASWDFQDLEGFVMAAKDRRPRRRPRKASAARQPAVATKPQALGLVVGKQLDLFDLT